MEVGNNCTVEAAITVEDRGRLVVRSFVMFTLASLASLPSPAYAQATSSYDPNLQGRIRSVSAAGIAIDPKMSGYVRLFVRPRNIESAPLCPTKDNHGASNETLAQLHALWRSFLKSKRTWGLAVQMSYAKDLQSDVATPDREVVPFKVTIGSNWKDCTAQVSGVEAISPLIRLYDAMPHPQVKFITWLDDSADPATVSQRMTRINSLMTGVGLAPFGAILMSGGVQDFFVKSGATKIGTTQPISFNPFKSPVAPVRAILNMDLSAAGDTAAAVEVGLEPIGSIFSGANPTYPVLTDTIGDILDQTQFPASPAAPPVPAAFNAVVVPPSTKSYRQFLKDTPSVAPLIGLIEGRTNTASLDTTCKAIQTVLEQDIGLSKVDAAVTLYAFAAEAADAEAISGSTCLKSRKNELAKVGLSLAEVRKLTAAKPDDMIEQMTNIAYIYRGIEGVSSTVAKAIASKLLVSFSGNLFDFDSHASRRFEHADAVEFIKNNFAASGCWLPLDREERNAWPPDFRGDDDDRQDTKTMSLAVGTLKNGTDVFIMYGFLGAAADNLHSVSRLHIAPTASGIIRERFRARYLATTDGQRGATCAAAPILRRLLGEEEQRDSGVGSTR